MQAPPRTKRRRLLIEIEPRQVTSCAGSFVTLAAVEETAVDEPQTHATETVAVGRDRVARWGERLSFMVTMHRAGVYTDDPFDRCPWRLELREPAPAARAGVRGGEESQGAAAWRVLCTYRFDIAEYCDPREDRLTPECVLTPEGRGNANVRLSLAVTSQHCEEVPVRRLRQLGQDNIAETLSAEVDALATALETEMNTLATVQQQAEQAQAAASNADADADALAEQLRASEEQLRLSEERLRASREECRDVEHEAARLHALAKAGGRDGADPLSVEPETFLSLHRDLVRGQREIQRLRRLLAEAEACLRGLSASAGEGAAAAVLQRMVAAARAENDTLWQQLQAQGEGDLLRKHVLLLERDLAVSCHDIAAIRVVFFSRCQRDRC